jgi:ABC-type antimicrobial peptide transport system permease subunit
MLTGAYRKTFIGSENLVKSGTGGYQLWVETSFPVVVNLNSEEGRNRLIAENDSDLYGVHFFQFISLEGDDASCLNLNQVQKPRILGVPSQEFDTRGAFSFARLAAGIDREHPWKALEKEYGSNIFPAFADQTVIHYGLKKSLGDTLVFLNEQGKPFRLILAGGLDNSIFQGNLLVSDSVLRAQFPSTGGSRIMLVETPPAKVELISEVLKNSLPDYGVEITTATTRLAQFNSVENTYLTVFMMLGGLGLLIGTFGLGLVLLRNIMERRHELALLIALGYRKKLLARLILTEYLFLLLAGVCCGSFSAFIAIMPSFLSPVFTLHPGYLVSIILMIVLSGSLWIFVSARYILHQDLITALRED